MDLLTFGLILFLVLHCLPFFPKLKNTVCNRLGHKTYYRGFSLVSLAALVIIGFGYADAPMKPFGGSRAGVINWRFTLWRRL